jgi:hypothetical protein
MLMLCDMLPVENIDFCAFRFPMYLDMGIFSSTSELSGAVPLEDAGLYCCRD